MEFSLFPHNKAAYGAALLQLARTGKAAVVHPTGTGKSFIGFYLAMEHGGSSVLWLGPSEYIYKTQVENLAACGAEVPGNIRFCTYAKLAHSTREEIEAMQGDFIILDEFHRCGARMWGQGVEELLSSHKGAKVLGLSATSIRYLDNQRDMAAELFEGNIASEITLGEAIARGILQAPRYITSVYSMQKEISRLQSRVRRAKSAEVREEAQKYLDALRRALDKADGLDVIFDRHITERHGKYLVFCSDVAHLHSIKKVLPQWMVRVDTAPHIYTAYSDDPATDRAFKAFKADSSPHIKLMCCIDMLNEGVHVEDVQGVILVRPTISPIIYKQQVGRALSASKNAGQPVIFDLVNNFDSLYSVDALTQEVEKAAAFYDYRSSSPLVVKKRFSITDEARDCREIFEALNDTLTASWEMMFAHAEKWYAEHGNLNIPRQYKTAEGYSLGVWISIQRRVNAGTVAGRLTEEQKERLDSLGMDWELRPERAWARYLEAARQYYARHGNLDVAARYVTQNGLALGAWIARVRQARLKPMRGMELTPERIAALDAMGMIWSKVNEAQEQYYAACVEYHRKHGNLNVPEAYKTPGGLRLGSWLRRLRAARKGSKSSLSDEFIARLDALGMVWMNRIDQAWENGFRHLAEYKNIYGDINVPGNFICADGFALGAWIARHFTTSGGRTGMLLTPARRKRLENLGVNIAATLDNAWEHRFSLLQAYYEEHGNIAMPFNYAVQGMHLARWLSEQRMIYAGCRRGKSLAPEQIARLEALGMEWEASPWEKMFRRFASGENCPVWLNRQRKLYREGKLTPQQIEKLEALNIDWLMPQERAWENAYAEAHRYYAAHGNLEIPARYVTESGFKLGRWLATMRHGRERLTPERTTRLNRLGMRW